MNVKQFNQYIVIPTLKEINLYSKAAAELVLGTAVYESGGLKHIKQLEGGPALGVCQMEPSTHNDIWDNYLKYKYELPNNIMLTCNIIVCSSDNLIYNLRYAVAMCRVHYLRVPKALPAAGDRTEQGKYYKQYYNTPLGKGSVDGYLSAYIRRVVNAP